MNYNIIAATQTKESNFQNTNKKTQKIWKVLYLSQASLRGWGRPCCWPAPWTLASSPAHLQSGKTAWATKLTAITLPPKSSKLKIKPTQYQPVTHLVTPDTYLVPPTQYPPSTNLVPTWSQWWNILCNWLLSTSPWTRGHWICKDVIFLKIISFMG